MSGLREVGRGIMERRRGWEGGDGRGWVFMRCDDDDGLMGWCGDGVAKMEIDGDGTTQG